MSSSDDFFKGLIFGSVVGIAAGVLLAPKSGTETREDIKKFAQDTSDKMTSTYKKARKDLERKMKDVKSAGKNIDVDEYKRLVNKVVDEIKADGTVTSEVAKQIGMKLNNDWNDMKSSIV